MNPRTIGMVGLGLLGGALAGRLLKAGFAVMGFDRDPERCRFLASLGGDAAGSAGAVAQTCHRLIFSLPNTPVVEAVLQEIAPHLHAGTEIVDTTTGDPARTAATGAALSPKGIHYLDATI